jgi:hypothetical protein
MSETKPQAANAGNLTPEQVQSVGGGNCSPSDIIQIIGNLTTAYESLIDFTSHVMERVST